ncbi:hypothetical protein C491_17424 [Natronococcus amylolyticus DSM 10524]|uniref:DUF8136 domain-containing protein n=1 Tax=Natronococcus amylolyticus DSM 10524 TaxID=1227497 RepID=L9X0N9_9EURY|nr:hypothetical protein [Natronococcus amylolyticus]ELY54991.1 hypothetical protein C491_17424 [Natronococcus amylolyticus DSM 10524]
MRTETGFEPSRTDREQILEILAETIDEMQERIDPPAADSPEEQELQIKWIRAQGYLAGQYRKLLKDEDLDVLEEEVDLLKTVSGLEKR